MAAPTHIQWGKNVIFEHVDWPLRGMPGPYRVMEDCIGDQGKGGRAACMQPLQRKW